jgi:Domain of unknown function (DUF4265)
MTAYYDEHPSRVSAWRDGKFVVHPNAASEDCTVWFPMGHDGESDGRWEGLLAQRLAPDRARICAIPFWARGVSLGDEVSVIESGEGAPVAVTVVNPSGLETIWVGFRDANREADDRWQDLMRDLESFQCWFDVLSPMFLSVSVSPEFAAAVMDYLATRVSRGELDYETNRGSSS